MFVRKCDEEVWSKGPDLVNGLEATSMFLARHGRQADQYVYAVSVVSSGAVVVERRSLAETGRGLSRVGVLVWRF